MKFSFQQEFVATGLKKDDFFFGDISTLYKGKNTIVDLKIDSRSSVRNIISSDTCFLIFYTLAFLNHITEHWTYIYIHAGVNERNCQKSHTFC